jgi:hypothetical protein
VSAFLVGVYYLDFEIFGLRWAGGLIWLEKTAPCACLLLTSAIFFSGLFGFVLLRVVVFCVGLVGWNW